MKRTVLVLTAPMAILAGACDKNDPQPPIDDALKNDLALAAQAQAYAPPYISPDEAVYGYSPQGYPVQPQ